VSKKSLTIRMMGEDHIVVFHHCDREHAAGPFGDQSKLPVSYVDTTKVLLRMDFDKFVEKKFKPLKCVCGLKVTPDELIFDYFKDRIMSGE
jgi:hypothetical protein